VPSENRKTVHISHILSPIRYKIRRPTFTRVCRGREEGKLCVEFKEQNCGAGKFDRICNRGSHCEMVATVILGIKLKTMRNCRSSRKRTRKVTSKRTATGLPQRRTKTADAVIETREVLKKAKEVNFLEPHCTPEDISRNMVVTAEAKNGFL
jgi:hypothetical protein